MELQHGTKVLRSLEAISKTTARVEARLEPKVGIKKILETSARVFLGDHERDEAEVRINGRVVTRIVFIDENDGFNSEERTNNFSEKIILSNAAAVVELLPSAHVTEARTTDHTSSSADAQVQLEITIMGLTSREVKFVRAINGEVETKTEKSRIATWGQLVTSKFEVEERIDLDRACEGVLGVDLTPTLREIVVGDGKVTTKGSATITLQATKRTDELSIYNDNIEFDFSKTIQHKSLGIDDSVFGTITVANIELRAESKDSPQLVVSAELEFRGFSIVSEEVESLEDAFSFLNELELKTSAFEGILALPSHHSSIEVDSNLSLGEKSPFITKILGVGTSSVSTLNIIPQNDKVTIEGAIASTVTYECEEKQLHSQALRVPFSTSVKIDGVTVNHNIQAKVDVTAVKVRARRGRELLVDARLGVALGATSTLTTRLVSDVALGEVKRQDDSAILIYTVAEGETTWDIAKRLNCRASEILAQNNLEGGAPRAGEKIFIYRQHVVSF